MLIDYVFHIHAGPFTLRGEAIFGANTYYSLAAFVDINSEGQFLAVGPFE